MNFPKHLLTTYYTKFPNKAIEELKGKLFDVYLAILSTSKTPDSTCKIGYRNLAKILEMKSSNTLSNQISQLEKKGYIKRIKGTGLYGKRGIKLSGFRAISYKPLIRSDSNYTIVNDYILKIGLLDFRDFTIKKLTPEQRRFLFYLLKNEIKEESPQFPYLTTTYGGSIFCWTDNFKEEMKKIGFPVSSQRNYLKLLENMKIISRFDDSYIYNIEVSNDKVNFYANELINYWNNKVEELYGYHTSLIDESTQDESTHFICKKYPCFNKNNVKKIITKSDYNSAKATFSLIYLFLNRNLYLIYNLIYSYLIYPLKNHDFRWLAEKNVLQFLYKRQSIFNEIRNAIEAHRKCNNYETKLLLENYSNILINDAEIIEDILSKKSLGYYDFIGVIDFYV